MHAKSIILKFHNRNYEDGKIFSLEKRSRKTAIFPKSRIH